MSFQKSLPLAASVFVALAAALPAAHALTLYDDFSGGAIGPSKWYASESTSGGGILVEGRRAVGAGALRMEVKGYSDRFSNTGTGRASNRVMFQNASAITEMKATITPRIESFVTCAGNTSAGAVRYRLLGFFFNAGEGNAGSEYNDVAAGIQIYRLSNSVDAAGVFQVSGFVMQCSDNDCINTTSIGTPVSLGTTTLNTATDLHMTWDKANHQFIFQKNADAAQMVVYTQADTRAPAYNQKRMEVIGDMANCTATRASSYSGADFDNVYTN